MQPTSPQVSQKHLSPALEKYLTIIFRLECIHGACRASDIAEAAGVARPSVTSALRMLSRLGYVRYAPYKFVQLTEKGIAAGQKLAHRKMVLRDFFATLLQLPEAISESTACELEHILPDEVLLRLRQFVLYTHQNEQTWRNWREDYARLGPTLSSAHPMSTPGMSTPAISTPAMSTPAMSTPGTGACETSPSDMSPPKNDTAPRLRLQDRLDRLPKD